MVFESEEQRKVTYRRLILSKQLYLHGLEHSNTEGELNKMIAIHNFHNSIEITLRAILLGYEIRVEKQLNIEFEVMLNEIDNHKDFKESKIKLPYRQELRNLNQLRNLVQHHAVEPETSKMDDWKVFTRRFLIKSFKQYFNIDFDTISASDFISDNQLKELLKIAEDFLISKDNLKAVFFAKLAFISASDSITEFLPERNHRYNNYSGGDEIDKLIGIFNKEIDDVHTKIDDVYHHTALLSTGISLANLKKFERLTPGISFGYSSMYFSKVIHKPILKEANWVVDFVVITFTNWQLQGLNPKIMTYSHSIQKILDNIDNLDIDSAYLS